MAFFIKLFLVAVKSKELKLGPHVNSGRVYCVYRYQDAAAAYYYLYSLFFSLSNCQTSDENIRHFFFSKREVKRVDTWYTFGSLVDVSSIPNTFMLLLICYFVFPFISLQISDQKKIFVTLLLVTVKPRELNLVRIWAMGGCIAYTEI